MGIIDLADGEEGVHGVVGRDEKTSKVGQELTPIIKEDQKDVDEADTTNGVDFGNTGLLLEVVERRVLGQLGWSSQR